MRKRTLGRTNLSVTELGLGTWGLSGDGYGPVSERDQDATLERALTLGINLFDTADCYAAGAMESKLGERLPSDGSVHVVTKIGTDRTGEPARKRFDTAFLKESFERCQTRLKREKLDIVLLHNPSAESVKQGEAAAFMQQLVDDNQLTAWGISAGAKDVLYAGLTLPKKPHVVELAYNMFMSRDLAELQYDLEHTQVGVLARSVLAHGLLAGYWTHDKQFSAHDHRHERWTQDQLKRRLHQLQAMKAVVGGTVPTPRSAALRYVLDNKKVSAAILGPRSPMQLTQLVREAGKAPPYLDAHAKSRLETRLHELGVFR
jgi:aryl-alcohol dehydrogenase-like predicted oxidoreductase